MKLAAVLMFVLNTKIMQKYKGVPCPRFEQNISQILAYFFIKLPNGATNTPETTCAWLFLREK